MATKKEPKVQPAQEAASETVNETMKVAENGHAPARATAEIIKTAEKTPGVKPAAIGPVEDPVETESETKHKTGRRPKTTEPEDLEAEVGLATKTFLVPYMLLMLRDSILHGYAIWENLMKLSIPGLDESDRATIYRTLRQLEREGKVKSEWDTKTEGPARRVYSLTEAGESFLQIWALGLKQYRDHLDFLFKMSTGGRLPSPLDFFNYFNRSNNSSKGGKGNA